MRTRSLHEVTAAPDQRTLHYAVGLPAALHEGQLFPPSYVYGNQCVVCGHIELTNQALLTCRDCGSFELHVWLHSAPEP